MPTDVNAIDSARARERTLHTIWCEALELDEVSADRTFLELGGDSLAAMRIMWMVAKRLGVTLSPIWFVEYPTRRDLTEHVAASDRVS